MAKLNRERSGSLVKELEMQQKEVKRWANLNELIGDATVNKYSKFAQELTLQQMLSLANRHLMKLDQRYLLKYNPQQNEDLFVVDTLQGNQERSVRTLSGSASISMPTIRVFSKQMDAPRTSPACVPALPEACTIADGINPNAADPH